MQESKPKTTYKDALRRSMDWLADDPKTLFLGYGIRHGGRAAGTLVNVPVHQLIETPCAENLMMGMAIGLALDGFLPVVFFERFDFITNAVDALVNHLDKLPTLSAGRFNPKVLIRCVVGGEEKPLYTGPTHTQDFLEGLAFMAPHIEWFRMINAFEVFRAYQTAYLSERPCLLVEYKDQYDTT
jgi:pyruvate/2-oxoglutarate/acetoin dehydrogenase E1 component